MRQVRLFIERLWRLIARWTGCAQWNAIPGDRHLQLRWSSCGPDCRCTSREGRSQANLPSYQELGDAGQDQAASAGPTARPGHPHRSLDVQWPPPAEGSHPPWPSAAAATVVSGTRRADGPGVTYPSPGVAPSLFQLRAPLPITDSESGPVRQSSPAMETTPQPDNLNPRRVDGVAGTGQVHLSRVSILSQGRRHQDPPPPGHLAAAAPALVRPFRLAQDGERSGDAGSDRGDPGSIRSQGERATQRRGRCSAAFPSSFPRRSSRPVVRCRGLMQEA